MRNCVLLSVVLVGAGLLAVCASRAAGEERTEHFDTDPGWDGYHNRSTAVGEKTVVQRFGHSPTHHAGGQDAGEMGGLVQPAAEPAYYAKKIPPATFGNKLTASGTLACAGRFHALIGFFNAGTLNEWRTPNTIAIRVQGRGEKFFAFVEYASGRWRAGGDSPGGFATLVEPATLKRRLRGFEAGGKAHRWTLSYDPQSNGGQGSIVVTIDNETAECRLDAGHKLDGASFDRFGLLTVMKQWDDPGLVWLDDVTVNGQLENFTSDPHWDASGNQRTYVTSDVRPRFDFGYSPTHFAGGARTGELGGLVFRGDIRYPNRMAYYADRLEKLTLDRPLRASGTISLHRAVSDSGTLIGFFNSQESIRTSESQATGRPKCFLGVAVEGPSRSGFFVYPTYRGADGTGLTAAADDRPAILPDKSVHRWMLEYRPEAAGGNGQITAALDGKSVRLDLRPSDRAVPILLDRFGIVSTWIDGNGQHIYCDDLTYTCRQDK
jgi:hypothetical protein